MQLPRKAVQRCFVHLAYLDDSDTKQKRRKWQVMAGVIMPDKAFSTIEYSLSVIREDLTGLIPPEKLDKFEEFHACELYGGHGVFEGTAREPRIDAIEKLLLCLKVGGLSVVYGAVDLDDLQSKVYASADPLDISFRICGRGIQSWIEGAIADRAKDKKSAEFMVAMLEGWLEELVVLIVDDCDPKQKNVLRKSFLSLRRSRITASSSSGPLFHFHDDMYFGDSRYSIGIQLADLCSYFIARHLDGDVETQGFYEMIEPYIVFSETHPEKPKAPAPLIEVPKDGK